jgi:NADPH:quinone reductase-like Zn-dependent oxidoreductase
MSKELICPEPGKVEWRTYEEREPESGEVRVRCEFAAAKHGTEMAIFKGYATARGRFDKEYQLHLPGGAFFSYPSPMGNMAVGRVEEQGAGISVLAIGDRVCV